MNYSFEKDLQNLGLSEKESRVYLASLELGPSPVQAIAKKALVNRATTYVMIESLIQRGLISSVKKGKKTLFISESPEHLKHFIQKELSRVEEKRKLLDTILPHLSSIIDSTSEKPKVEMFEGLDGLREIHEDILEHGPQKATIDNIASVDDARELVLFDEVANHWEKMAGRKIKVRAILTQSSSAEKIPEKLKHMWEERFVPKEKFSFHGELVIYGDKVAALAYRGRIIGAIIESHEIAHTLRCLFQLAWDGAEKYN